MKTIMRAFALLSSIAMVFACNKNEIEQTITVETAEVTEITPVSAKSGGKVITAGGVRITAYGVCWSKNQNPKVTDEKTEDGDGDGEFVSEIEGLDPGCVYYARAYAVSSKGVTYGNEVTFSTGKVLASVTTLPMRDVTFETAVTGGRIDFDGGAEISSVGVCWGTAENPDIEGLHTEDELEADGGWTSVVDGLQADETYYVRAYAVNEVGVAYGNVITFGTSSEPVISALGDEALWQFILEHYDTNNDGKIQISESLEVTVIDCPAAGICTIAGIGQFENLRDLRLNGNKLTSADLTANRKLEIFWGQDNPELAEVNISGLENLQYLHCQNTKISAVDFSSAVNMTEINLFNTQLESIDVKYCNALQVLNVENTRVQSIDVSNKPALWYLNVRGNSQITSLEIEGCSGLRDLYVDNTSIARIDAHGLESLEIIWAFNMRVENVELTADNCSSLKFLHGYNEDLVNRPNGHFIKCSAKNCPNLLEYRCFGNPNITEADFTGSFMNDGGAGEINLDGAHLTSLVVSSEQKSLSYMNIHQNRLESLDLSNMPSLKFLHCGSSDIRNINLSGSKALEEVYVMNNSDLTGLDLTGCDALRIVWAFTNPSMKTLNLASCRNLYYLDANSSALSGKLEFRDMPNLWQTILWGTQVSEAVYENVPCLEHFNFENAPLQSITVSGAPALEYAILVNTRISSCDMTGASGLRRLAVRNTPSLKTVNILSNSQLHSFWGWDTSMESLDLRGCADAMNEVMVDANPSLKAIYLRQGQTINTFNKDASVEVIVQ